MADKTSIRQHLDSLGFNPNLDGAGAVAQGVQAARQQNIQNQIAQQQLQNQNQETVWKNPNRTPSDLDRLKEQGNPLQQALAQLIQSSPVPKNAQITGVGYAYDPYTGKPITPQAQGQQTVQGLTASNTAPTPIQKFDWLTATPEDLAGWQAEMKKRQSSRTF